MDVYHYTAVHQVLNWQQPINTCLSVSLILIKQQNIVFTKIILYFIYTVNTMCYVTFLDLNINVRPYFISLL